MVGHQDGKQAQNTQREHLGHRALQGPCLPIGPVRGRHGWQEVTASKGMTWVARSDGEQGEDMGGKK
jgi:hypothetical protein